jgi:hypothetical protein
MSQEKYGSQADKYADQYGVPRDLYRAVIQQESGWNPGAKSPRGAQGLSQVMPATGRDPGFGVKPLSDGGPEDNLRFGAEYLGSMLKRYGGNTKKALAAYNWGAGNADDWDGEDMSVLPGETNNYVSTISSKSTNGINGVNTPQVNTSILNPDNSMGPSLENGFLSNATNSALGLDPRYNLADQQDPSQRPRDPNWNSMKGLTDIPSGGSPDGSQGPFQNGAIGAEGSLSAANADPAATGLKGWLQKGDRSDTLLSIGTGLLSGNNWAEGIGAAGTNVMANNKEKRGIEREDSLLEQARRQQLEDAQQGQTWNRENAAIDQGYAIDRIGATEAAQRAAKGLDPVGNMLMKDGTIRGDLRYDGSNYVDPEGNSMTDQVDRNVNNSFGEKGALAGGEYIKQSQSLTSQGNALKSMDKIIGALDDTAYGIDGMMADFTKNLKTLASMDLSPEEMIRAQQQGRAQGILGGLKDTVVGPGVMTEQDAFRIVLAMGGDFSSMLSNPEVMKKQLMDIYELNSASYNTLADSLDSQVAAYPQNSYVPNVRYRRPTKGDGTTPPSGGAGNNPDIADILKLPQYNQ